MNRACSAAAAGLIGTSVFSTNINTIFDPVFLSSIRPSFIQMSEPTPTPVSLCSGSQIPPLLHNAPPPSISTSVPASQTVSTTVAQPVSEDLLWMSLTMHSNLFGEDEVEPELTPKVETEDSQALTLTASSNLPHASLTVKSTNSVSPAYSDAHSNVTSITMDEDQDKRDKIDLWPLELEVALIEGKLCIFQILCCTLY